MSNYSIFRFTDKVTNKPLSESPVKQVDLFFNFYSSPQSGDSIFYIPRHTTNFDLLDSKYGSVIDFGVDWSKAELKISNPIVSATFFDELYSCVDEEAQNLFEFLKKDYYITSHKNERWKIKLDNKWAINYIANMANQPNKDIDGRVIANNDNLVFSRFLWHEDSLYRVWSDGTNVKISSSNGWTSFITLGLGINPSLEVLGDVLYVAYERANKIYYKKRIDGLWGSESLVNQVDSEFPLRNPPYNPSSEYHYPFLMRHEETIYLYYIERNLGKDDIKYVLSSQDFRSELRIPNLEGEKSDLVAYWQEEDDIIFISWVNNFNGVTNIYLIFSDPVRNIKDVANLSGYANKHGPLPNWNPIVERNSIGIPIDEAFFELV